MLSEIIGRKKLCCQTRLLFNSCRGKAQILIDLLKELVLETGVSQNGSDFISFYPLTARRPIFFIAIEADFLESHDNRMHRPLWKRWVIVHW